MLWSGFMLYKFLSYNHNNNSIVNSYFSKDNFNFYTIFQKWRISTYLRPIRLFKLLEHEKRDFQCFRGKLRNWFLTLLRFLYNRFGVGFSYCELILYLKQKIFIFNKISYNDFSLCFYNILDDNKNNFLRLIIQSKHVKERKI